MERGVVVGGLLISASFMLAVLLNHSAKEPVSDVRHESAGAAESAPVKRLSVTSAPASPQKDERCDAGKPQRPADNVCPDSGASVEDDTP